MKIKLGADPEFFLIKNKTVVPAVGLVKGTKEEPFKLNKGAVQLDGTAVEFNIDAASSPEEFADNIMTVLTQIRESIPSEYSFSFSPSVIYTHEIWKTIPNSAKELGCNPDYSAYDGRAKVPPALPKNLETMRTGAGHLHIGFTDVKDPHSKDHLFDCCLVTKALDSVFRYIIPQFDTDVQRQRLYGMRGSFRPKTYGVEYRVLSNAWLSFPGMWPWMFDLVQLVLTNLENGNDIHRRLGINPYSFYGLEANRSLSVVLGKEYKNFDKSMLKQRLVM